MEFSVIEEVTSILFIAVATDSPIADAKAVFCAS
jgi:hypothetical protein